MERDLAMVGGLNAVRGVYSFVGRQFQVQEGTVTFLGTPGMNPNLDIQALNRLRTAENEPLDITAHVQGTLLSPRVSLSSNAPFPISESDLVSYLIFGRPTYALATGQSSLVRGAAGSLLGAATGAGVTLGLGVLSSELGSVFTRDVGLDYLSISQGQDADPFGTLGVRGTVATTEVEVGQYLTDEIFAALTWRPGERFGSGDDLAGLRFEWRMSDLWTLEGFLEDRFARSPLFRAADIGYRLDKVLGFFFYRQWGY
jgi:autotransporter translocation and assembly factor TamB